VNKVRWSIGSNKNEGRKEGRKVAEGLEENIGRRFDLAFFITSVQIQFGLAAESTFLLES
jgi:hypothetical protein